MKLYPLVSFLLLSTFTFSSFAEVKVEIPIVYDFQKAKKEKIWEGVNEGLVPKELLAFVTVKNPGNYYEAPNENIFLQNKYMVVCLKECSKKQNFKPIETSVDVFIQELIKVPRLFGKKEAISLNGQIIRQGTVYYWVNKLFEKLESLGFVPEKKLKIFIDRDFRDLTTNAKLENNAFYNRDTNSLTFLPADNNYIGKKLFGTYRSSGYDPTVAVHEAGHFVFNELTNSNNINTEISGFNEGFADYLAMITLNTSEIGNVMLSGKSLRNALKEVRYKKNQEVHELGNSFSGAFWEVRKIIQDSEIADKVVLELARRIGESTFATAFDVISFHKDEALKIGVSPEIISKFDNIYKKRGLIGSYKYDRSHSQLNSNPITGKYIGLKITTKFNKEIAKDYGQDPVAIERYTLIGKKQLKKLDESKKESYMGFLVAKSNFDNSENPTFKGENESPIWLIAELSSGNILEARHMLGDGTLSEEEIDDLPNMSRAINTLTGYEKIDEYDSLENYLGKNTLKVKFENKKIRKEVFGMILDNENGVQKIDVVKVMVKVKLKGFFSKAINLILGGGLGDIENAIFYLTSDKRLEGLTNKVRTENGPMYLIGEKLKLETGLEYGVIIEKIGER